MIVNIHWKGIDIMERPYKVVLLNHHYTMVKYSILYEDIIQNRRGFKFMNELLSNPLPLQICVWEESP